MVFKRDELKARISFTQPFDGNLVEVSPDGMFSQERR
jgi:hypothetical protein